MSRPREMEVHTFMCRPTCGPTSSLLMWPIAFQDPYLLLTAIYYVSSTTKSYIKSLPPSCTAQAYTCSAGRKGHARQQTQRPMQPRTLQWHSSCGAWYWTFTSLGHVPYVTVHCQVVYSRGTLSCYHPQQGLDMLGFTSSITYIG